MTTGLPDDFPGGHPERLPARLRVLELGSYIAPAVAGSLLVEQGALVTKWTKGVDPMISHQRGGEALWEFYTAGKQLRECGAKRVANLPVGAFHAIIDNHRPEAWARWGVDPAAEADRLGIMWVSIRDDLGGRGFDVVAQARAWGVDAPPVPFFVGDTAAGLTAAFVLTSRLAAAMCGAPPGHFVVGQAAALAKLREGDLAVRPPQGYWHDPAEYDLDATGALVQYRGETIHEPPRDDEWRREHLDHIEGRIVVGRRQQPQTGTVEASAE